ncbi:unnamed protein product, partial [Mesorhabditis spiculigera]
MDEFFECILGGLMFLPRFDADKIKSGSITAEDVPTLIHDGKLLKSVPVEEGEITEDWPEQLVPFTWHLLPHANDEETKIIDALVEESAKIDAPKRGRGRPRKTKAPESGETRPKVRRTQKTVAAPLMRFEELNLKPLAVVSLFADAEGRMRVSTLPRMEMVNFE